jgi:hypothetical protein
MINFSTLLLHLVVQMAASAPVQNTNTDLPSTKPAFTVDYVMPTADKPQSKLWYNQGWWALIPRASGPSLWERTDHGWQEHSNVVQALKGVPGQADVWPHGAFATAVGVSERALTVFRLTKKVVNQKFTWQPEILANLTPPSAGMTMETATIVCDSKGRWWVAAVADDQVCVWSGSKDGKVWKSPVVLARGLDKDDICAVTPIQKGIAVIWSDQVRQAMVARERRDDRPVTEWNEETLIELGNHNADDHIKTSLSKNGTLWVATKNSVDEDGKPQLVLRVRTAAGKWTNHPYMPLKPKSLPTRPAVFATQHDGLILCGHGDNYTRGGNPYHSEVTFGLIDTTKKEILQHSKVVIAPEPAYQDSFIQNVTGPRHAFPKNAPWIILASDRKGRVYEADLRQLISTQHLK